MLEFVRSKVVSDDKLLMRVHTMKSHHPDMYEQVMQQYPAYTTYRDKVFAIANGDYKRCKQCGSIMSYKRESEFCSRKCYHASNEFKDNMAKLHTEQANTKRKEVLVERYGVTNPMQVEEFKDKNKYSPNRVTGFRKNNPAHNPESVAKRKQTMVDRYGVEHALQNESLLAKALDNALKTRRKAKRERLEQAGITTPTDNPIGRHGAYVDDEMIRIVNGVQPPNIEAFRRNYVNWRHHAKQFGIQLPKSTLESDLADFLKQCGVTFKTNDRRIIAPLELDFVIPSHRLAIEINGLHWHDSFHIDPKYHLNKTNACERAGYQLIHIWENDWLCKRHIVEGILRAKLGLNYRVYARRCEVVDVSDSEAQKFYDTFHLKGYRTAKYHIGLKWAGGLAMCMSFSVRGSEYELIRMASGIGVTVVGGMSKLLKCFYSQHLTPIFSFVDRDISNGKAYFSCGFKIVAPPQPSYWYVDKRTYETVSRHRLMKHKLTHLPEYNELLTEAEIVQATGCYYRIHNAGNLLMRWSGK